MEYSSSTPKNILMAGEETKTLKRKASALQDWKMIPISFPPIKAASANPVVIQIRLANFEVNKAYIDTGSSIDIIYEHCFRQLPEKIQHLKKPPQAPLIGFSGETHWPVGEVVIEVMMGEYPYYRREDIIFAILKAPSQYNVLLGRPSLEKFGAIPSTIHGMIKFPTPSGIATIEGRMTWPQECKQIEQNDEITQDLQKEVIDGPEQRVIINPKFADQPITIGSHLPPQIKDRLVKLLRSNMDVFAWQTSDMTGVPRNLAEHALNANPNIVPIRQKKRGMAPERSKSACDQVLKMVDAGIVREVRYQTWIANPVMVKKGDGTWRLCVDFKDINKACPKDNYPLPVIDWKVESLDGFRLKCFLDAYKGYHQIHMKKSDEDKTAFHTDQGIYCFQKMPFGLKNAGATYQRLIDKAFKDQIGRNLEAYVDDIVIKSKTDDMMLKDIQETFDTLRRINMKLNPSKCSFGMEEGKFLGHIVTTKGIKANPKKIQAIIDMPSPKTKKQVQSLNGKLAALNRFLSKAADRSLPFFNTLKGCIKKQDFSWSNEAEEAFQEIKQFLTKVPTLTAPIPGEVLVVYLAASKECVSAVLLANRGPTQMPIYFVSRALKGAEINYPSLEKLALALVHASRRLRRYFQAHPIHVLTDKPIKQVLGRPEVSGRLAKWAIELGEHEISFQPRNSMKGQILADFLAEIEGMDESMVEQKIPSTPNTIKDQKEVVQEPSWTLFTDGASSMEGSGAGLILIDPHKNEYTYALKFDFPTTNNEAEYEALLSGLRIARKMDVQNIKVFVDSQLVANHINGIFEANQTTMQQYLEETKRTISDFKTFKIEQVPRNKNKIADALSKLAASSFAHLKKELLVEILKEKSIVPPKEVVTIEEEDCWITPIKAFIVSNHLPEDKHLARKIRMKAPMYTVLDGHLFRKSFLGPHLRCVGPTQARQIIRDVHGGTCGIHAGPRSVTTKVMRLGYFWPTMHSDAKNEIEKCDSCQRHASVSRMPKHDLIPVTTAWPFYKWGIDIVGPFPPAVGNVKFLLVAVDYFTKWIEAKPLATITGTRIINFVWEQIVCRFGVPHVIVSDNGKQFAENPFKTWCQDMNIQQRFTSVAHPQANGQVEVMNKAIVKGIKARLGVYQKAWVDEIPGILWAHRTTPGRATSETPFSLVYGTEAVIPPELTTPTQRILHFTPSENEERLRENLNILEERREIALIKQAENHRRMAKYYNQKVNYTNFKPSDLVWRKNEASRVEDLGKLGPTWEGPYKVLLSHGNGSYTLSDLDGREIPRTWNAINLKRCYI